MKALEKRPEDRYQSAEEMSHDLEEFLEESGMRSGNRRVSLYIQDLFAPEARTSEAGVAASRAFSEPRPQPSSSGVTREDNSEELDLDRRAPLAMRIEVAPEPAAPTARGSSAGSGSARVRGAASSAGSGSARQRLEAEPPVLPARPARETESQIVTTPSRPMGWVIVAVLIAIGVAAMVIMTLK